MKYFAYGSNLSTARFKARLPRAQFISTATLTGHRLCFHKVSEDGSGKCDIVASNDSGDLVHGVVYEIDQTERLILDEIEGAGTGYDPIEISVTNAGGQITDAFSYQASITDSAKLPYSWYHAFVLAGAKEHGFPEDYVASIEAIETIPDPDSDRCRMNQQVLIEMPYSE